MCFSHIQHGLNKILAIHTKHPRNANNKIFLQYLTHCQLTFQLCLSINIERRIILAVRLPRFGSLSVKYIVGGNVNHFCIQFFADRSDISSSIYVNGLYFCLFVFILCQINSSPCSAVNHFVRTHLFHHSAHSLRVCDVHFRHVYAYSLIASFCKLVHYIVAKLSFYSCNQYLHTKPPISFSAKNPDSLMSGSDYNKDLRPS